MGLHQYVCHIASADRYPGYKLNSSCCRGKFYIQFRQTEGHLSSVINVS